MVGDTMEMLFASLLGYLVGSATVLFTLYVLNGSQKDDELEHGFEPETVEPSAEEKRWLEEMSALIAYDGKGGEMNGDKDNS